MNYKFNNFIGRKKNYTHSPEIVLKRILTELIK